MKHFIIFINVLCFCVMTPSRIMAEDALVIGPRPAQTDLASLAAKLKSADFVQVREAAIALASSRMPAALPPLWALYNQGDAQRRALAVQCAGLVGQGAQEDNLIRVGLADACLAVRREAAFALVQLGGAGAATDRATASCAKVAADLHAPLLTRVRALNLLAWMGGKDAGAVLSNWLKSSEIGMAVSAAEGLGILGDFNQVDALLATLQSPDPKLWPELRPEVADALEKLSGKKFHFDLIKWSEWQKEQQQLRKTKSPGDAAPNAAAPFNTIIQDSEIDLVIVYDTTGSMAHGWQELFGALDAVLETLIKQTPSLRIGAVKYRALNPRKALSYSIEPLPLTRQYGLILKNMKESLFGGGSGGPQLGLRHALADMNWRVGARKVVLLVGDISPQSDDAIDADTPVADTDTRDENLIRACMQNIQDEWQMDGVLTNTVYLKTVHGEQHRQTYRLLADAGAGHFYEYDKTLRRLVDMTGGTKVDANKEELPNETAEKWCNPREVKKQK